MPRNVSRSSKNFRKKLNKPNTKNANKNTKKLKQRKMRGGYEGPIVPPAPTTPPSNGGVFGWINGLFATNKEDEDMKNAKENCKNEYNNCVKNAEIKSIESKNTGELQSIK